MVDIGFAGALEGYCLCLLEETGRLMLSPHPTGPGMPTPLSVPSHPEKHNALYLQHTVVNIIHHDCRL
jgi:hypothetical protein